MVPYTLRRETRRDRGDFWYAYKRHEGRLYKRYCGAGEAPDPARLAAAERFFAVWGNSETDSYPTETGGTAEGTESHGDRYQQTDLLANALAEAEKRAEKAALAVAMLESTLGMKSNAAGGIKRTIREVIALLRESEGAPPPQ